MWMGHPIINGKVVPPSYNLLYKPYIYIIMDISWFINHLGSNDCSSPMTIEFSMIINGTIHGIISMELYKMIINGNWFSLIVIHNPCDFFTIVIQNRWDYDQLWKLRQYWAASMARRASFRWDGFFFASRSADSVEEECFCITSL